MNSLRSTFEVLEVPQKYSKYLRSTRSTFRSTRSIFEVLEVHLNYSKYIRSTRSTWKKCEVLREVRSRCTYFAKWITPRFICNTIDRLTQKPHFFPSFKDKILKFGKSHICINRHILTIWCQNNHFRRSRKLPQLSYFK